MWQCVRVDVRVAVMVWGCVRVAVRVAVKVCELNCVSTCMQA